MSVKQEAADSVLSADSFLVVALKPVEGGAPGEMRSFIYSNLAREDALGVLRSLVRDIETGTIRPPGARDS